VLAQRISTSKKGSAEVRSSNQGEQQLAERRSSIQGGPLTPPANWRVDEPLIWTQWKSVEPQLKAW